MVTEQWRGSVLKCVAKVPRWAKLRKIQTATIEVICEFRPALICVSLPSCFALLHFLSGIGGENIHIRQRKGPDHFLEKIDKLNDSACHRVALFQFKVEKTQTGRKADAQIGTKISTQRTCVKVSAVNNIWN